MKKFIPFVFLTVLWIASFGQSNPSESKFYKAAERTSRYLGLNVPGDTVRLWAKWLETGENEQKSFAERQISWTKLINSILSANEAISGMQMGLYPMTLWTTQNVKFTSYGLDVPNPALPDQLGEIKKFGNGKEVLLLIPPVGFDYTVYSEFIEKNKNKYTLYAITLPGFGGTSPYSFSEKVNYSEQHWLHNVEAALYSLLNREKINQVYVLSTQSMAFVPLHMAILSPDRVAGVILINGIPTAQFSSRTPGKEADTKERASILELNFISSFLSTPRTAIPNLFTSMSKDPDKERKLWENANAKTNFLIYRQYAGELTAVDLYPDFNKLKVPVLALNSTYDQYSSRFGNNPSVREWNRAIAQFPDLPVTIKNYEGERAFLFIDKLPEISADIDDFINKTKPLKPAQMVSGSDIVFPSPPARLTQTFSNVTVDVSYSRPAVQGREIYGKLVPYKKVWRAGANHATNISVNRDVLVNGSVLKKGIYSFYIMPDEQKWTLLFNSLNEQWGTQYNKNYNVLSIEVTPEQVEHEEWLKYDVENLSGSSLDLVMHWEKKKIRLSFKDTFSTPAVPGKLVSANWVKLLEDKRNDGDPSDAKTMSFYQDVEGDSLWFRFDLYHRVNPNAAFAMILFDTDADQKTGSYWFGTNVEFKFDRTANVFVRKEGNRLAGLIGIGTDKDATTGILQEFSSLSMNTVRYYLNDSSYYIGVKRSAIDPKLKKFNVIGAVGEYTNWSDDVSDHGFATVILNDKNYKKRKQ